MMTRQELLTLHDALAGLLERAEAGRLSVSEQGMGICGCIEEHYEAVLHLGCDRPLEFFDVRCVLTWPERSPINMHLPVEGSFARFQAACRSGTCWEGPAGLRRKALLRHAIRRTYLAANL